MTTKKQEKPIAISTLFSLLGCPMKNVMWSWTAIAPSKERALFAIWEDEAINGKYKLGSDQSELEDRHGGRERMEICEQVIQHSIPAYGILCRAKNPDDKPRKRIWHDPDLVIKLRVTKAGKVYWAELGDTIPNWELVKSGNREWQEKSAIDDIESVPVGKNIPDRASQTNFTYKRDNKIRDYVIKKAYGRCEYCQQEGFEMPNHKKYLEAHHIIALASDGADTVDNVIALCPGHHREAHFGLLADELERKFVSIIQQRKR